MKENCVIFFLSVLIFAGIVCCVHCMHHPHDVPYEREPREHFIQTEVARENHEERRSSEFDERAKAFACARKNETEPDHDQANETAPITLVAPVNPRQYVQRVFIHGNATLYYDAEDCSANARQVCDIQKNVTYANVCVAKEKRIQTLSIGPCGTI